jgi:hypothetical protein
MSFHGVSACPNEEKTDNLSWPFLLSTALAGAGAEKLL